MERININGVWYRKELDPNTNEPSADAIPDLSDHIYHYRECSYEDEDIALTCTYSISDNPSVHDTPMVKFFDKDTKNKELWDSIRWMREVYRNNPESTELLRTKYLPHIRAFFKYLIDNGIL